MSDQISTRMGLLSEGLPVGVFVDGNASTGPVHSVSGASVRRSTRWLPERGESGSGVQPWAA